MDSQTLGTLAAAVITATAGLVGVMMTRRGNAERERDADLQMIRDEIELLAMLPEDNAMRAQLSEVLNDRIRGYTRIYKDEIDRPYSRVPPLAWALVGAGISFYMAWTGRADYILTLVMDVVLGKDVSSSEWQLGFYWLALFVLGMIVYVVSLRRFYSRIQTQRWARAARGAPMPNPPTWGETVGAMKWTWRHIAGTASKMWLRLRRAVKRDSAKELPRDSEPES